MTWPGDCAPGAGLVGGGTLVAGPAGLVVVWCPLGALPLSDVGPVGVVAGVVVEF